MSTLALPNITVEVLARSLGQAKEIRCIQIGRKVKLSVFAENMTLYWENPKASTKKKKKKNLLELNNEFSKAVEYKINIQKSIMFLNASDK